MSKKNIRKDGSTPADRAPLTRRMIWARHAASHQVLASFPSRRRCGIMAQKAREGPMSSDESDESGATRREVMAAAGLGLAAALAGVPPGAAGAERPADEFVTADYWAKKGDVPLYLYRKRLRAPSASAVADQRPVLFLVHGSSISGRSSYDLSVPGAGGYSMMNVFARLGYDVWTMDHEGYGHSSRTEGNSDVQSGVEDLKAASDVVAQESGRRKFHFFGESSGGLRAGAFAMAQPDRVDRLVLSAFVWTGEGSPTLGKRAEQLEYYRTHNRRKRDRDMIRSIFTRDKPGTSDPRVPEALADTELQFGDTIPTGTYLDMTANLPVVDPTKLQAPVLIVRGEYDGIATVQDLLDFFAKLPNADRQFVMLAGAAHAMGAGINRAQLWHCVQSFLALPPRQDV
jgi:alpha-beta hydrolase superfamily lysophospholipase